MHHYFEICRRHADYIPNSSSSKRSKRDQSVEICNTLIKDVPIPSPRYNTTHSDDSLPSSSSNKKSKRGHSVEICSTVRKDVPLPPPGYNPTHSVSCEIPKMLFT